MPAKKAASKKRKKSTTARKKPAAKKAAASKKKAQRKKTVARKKAATRKPAKKKVSKKKVAKKKVAKKKAAKKVAKKKVAKKAAAKRVAKKVAKKKVSKKKVSKKTVARKATKKVAKKVAKKRKVSSKKVAAKKPAARRTTPAKKTPARKKAPARPRGDILSGPIHGIAPYQAKRGEEYMSPEQLEHFEAILKAWKHELMNEVDRTVHHMQDEAANFPDPSDRATQESEFGLELRTRDRERKLLRKINSALTRIEDGSYGYCEETGEEIGLKRLEARPVATLCLEAQERREMAERQYRDRDDRYR